MAQPTRIDDLPLTPADASSPVPLYHQIEMDLRLLIQSGRLEPDELLPPELELCRVYGVGRQTMRMALARLVADGLIARRAGQGTFVRYQPNRAQFYLDQSFTRQMAELGLTASSTVLKTERGWLDETAPPALRACVGSPFLLLERLRFGGGEPVALQESTIVTERCPDLHRHDFSQRSLYDVLSSEYHLVIGQINHAVTAVTADAHQAQLLAVEEGDALLVVKTNAFLDDGSIIESSVAYYRAGRYEFRTQHTG